MKGSQQMKNECHETENEEKKSNNAETEYREIE